MERKATVEEAKILFGKNFIGPESLINISEYLNFAVPQVLPELEYSIKELEEHSEDYILILAVSNFNNGKPVNIIEFRKLIGVNNDNDPSFYNQDWYLLEKFASNKLTSGWYFVRKEIVDSTRSLSPELISVTRKFPPAILCVYTFFIYYFTHKVLLWENDYLWCLDKDANGDRVYVGRYRDILGINNDGFSIHRHLSLKYCYGSI